MISLQSFVVTLLVAVSSLLPATMRGQTPSPAATVPKPNSTAHRETRVPAFTPCPTASYMETLKAANNMIQFSSTVSPTASQSKVSSTVSMTNSNTSDGTAAIDNVEVNATSATNTTFPECEPLPLTPTTVKSDSLTTTDNSVEKLQTDGTDSGNDGITITIPINRISISITVLVGFIVVILLPLIIFILLVALGCTCRKYRRLKKHMDQSNSMGATVEEDRGVHACNGALMELDEIETEENVAYSRKESYAYVIPNPYDSIHVHS